MQQYQNLHLKSRTKARQVNSKIEGKLDIFIVSLFTGTFILINVVNWKNIQRAQELVEIHRIHEDFDDVGGAVGGGGDDDDVGDLHSNVSCAPPSSLYVGPLPT